MILVLVNFCSVYLLECSEDILLLERISWLGTNGSFTYSTQDIFAVESPEDGKYLEEQGQEVSTRGSFKVP